ncbi:putative C6 transcription [Rosellinia necatrix]|uniref:Putative C6 transcription n=1 Tax=Rosellinia necatrix TaxID=77044 RepID=A0A1W2TKF7_ROSNE|nr:putative C6 transcription [Rosellinia necatrix]
MQSSDELGPASPEKTHEESSARRRPKPQVSCTQCRTRKLKCDRGLPCKNCRRRPPGSCVYVSSRDQRGLRRPVRQDRLGHISNRIQKLETFVTSAAREAAEGTQGEEPAPTLNERTPGPPLSAADFSVKLSGLAAAPALADREKETRLIDAESWEALLREIEIIKSNVDDMRGPESSTTTFLRPSLLFGFVDDVPIERLVNALPAKRVTDRLVNIFTRASHFPDPPIHLPTFLRDYKAFWENPREVELPWLSILFSAIAIALQFVVESGIDFEEIPFPEAASEKFASKAAECLRRSDYAKPVSKTVEAMLMCLLCEHTWLDDYHFRASLILSFAVRIAMRSGYHRDPSHFQEMSTFDGELRRRTWSLLVQLDFIFASYLGLPPHIRHYQNDTRLPADIPDEDLFPEMIDLPASRAADEPSTIGFLNYRSQIAILLGQIMDYVTSFREVSYEKILALDNAITEQANACPSWLKASTAPDVSVHGSINLNRAIEIDILQQRARITLHRRFLAPARTNREYSYSRDACLSAATRVLRHQRTLSKLSFDVDGMVLDNWRSMSLMCHDFLLSAMVLCVGIGHTLRDGLVFKVPPGSRYAIEDIREHLELLKSCQKFLASKKIPNPATHKAIQAIDTVVSKAYKALEANRDDPEPIQANTSELWLASTSSHPLIARGTSSQTNTSQTSNALQGISNTFFPPVGNYHLASPNSRITHEFPDGLATIFDWNTWES